MPQVFLQGQGALSLAPGPIHLRVPSSIFLFHLELETQPHVVVEHFMANVTKELNF